MDIFQNQKRALTFSSLAITAALAAVAIFAFVVLRDSDSSKNEVTQQPQAGQEQESEGGGPSLVPSISQLASKEFNGADFQMGRVLEEHTLYTRYYITYTSGDLTISGIMNVPKGEIPEGGFPVLFLNHGYIDPAIYTNGRGLRREQDYFARNGYVVVHSDYRNHAGSTKISDTDTQTFRLGYAEDVINGIVALREANVNFANTDRIGMLGHSMGGGIAQQIMVAKPDLVDAFMLYAPVSSDAYENFEKWVLRGEDRQEAAQQVLMRWGGPEENEEFWQELSPRAYFERVAAPVQLHHGTADESVPIEWSRATVGALESANKEVELFEYEGEPHEFAAAWPTVMERTRVFFDARLKGE